MGIANNEWLATAIHPNGAMMAQLPFVVGACHLDSAAAHAVQHTDHDAAGIAPFHQICVFTSLRRKGRRGRLRLRQSAPRATARAVTIAADYPAYLAGVPVDDHANVNHVILVTRLASRHGACRSAKSAGADQRECFSLLKDSQDTTILSLLRMTHAGERAA